jgi:hypothetical protein
MALTILIRTHQRPRQYARCLASVPGTCRVITHVQDTEDYNYVPAHISKCATLTHTKTEFFYNEFVNTLLHFHNRGHALILDDDDKMIALPPPLEDGISYLAPFMRGKFQTPWKPSIQRGLIGMPCLLLWHEHKELIHFEAVEDADYRAILSLSQQVELRWLEQPLVYSEKRNYGRLEVPCASGIIPGLADIGPATEK